MTMRNLNILSRLDDLLFFDYLGPFVFLLIEFIVLFPLYNILPDYVYY